MVNASLVGKTVDRYRLLELIGTGGMGSVYIGEHVKIQKKVAVKLLHPYLVEAQPSSVQRMLNEAKAAATIGHPGIVDVLDFGESDDGHHFLVMELLNGRTLDELMEEKGRLDPNLALAVADQVLSALWAAHKKGIVHRDLKPDNVFLNIARSGLYEVKLLDFGISKFTLDQNMKLTATGVVMGTPHYMSLEQTRGQTDVDLRTDLYAMGVILYRALSGKHPYDGQNVNQVIVAILKGEYVSLAKHCPDLPEELVAVIHRSIEGDRTKRFSTADELSTALRPFWDPRHASIEAAYKEVQQHCAGKVRSDMEWKFGFMPSSPEVSMPLTPARAEAGVRGEPVEPSSLFSSMKTTAPTQPPSTGAPTRAVPPPPPSKDRLEEPPPPEAEAIAANQVAPGTALTAQVHTTARQPRRRSMRQWWQSLTGAKKLFFVWLAIVIFLVIVLPIPIMAARGCGADNKSGSVGKHVKKAGKRKKKKKKPHRSMEPRFVKDVKDLF